MITSTRIDLTRPAGTTGAVAVPRTDNRASISVRQRAGYDATPWSARIQWAIADQDGRPHRWQDVKRPDGATFTVDDERPGIRDLDVSSVDFLRAVAQTTQPSADPAAEVEIATSAGSEER